MPYGKLHHNDEPKQRERSIQWFIQCWVSLDHHLLAPMFKLPPQMSCITLVKYFAQQIFPWIYWNFPNHGVHISYRIQSNKCKTAFMEFKWNHNIYILAIFTIIIDIFTLLQIHAQHTNSHFTIYTYTPVLNLMYHSLIIVNKLRHNLYMLLSVQIFIYKIPLELHCLQVSV